MDSQSSIVISQYNRYDDNELKREQSADALDIIFKMLESSEDVRGRYFLPTYALVVTWNNAIPSPYYLYEDTEVYLIPFSSCPVLPCRHFLLF